jgi:MOSC domain-containing protein YiiM/SAM-dependent methyltransferase
VAIHEQAAKGFAAGVDAYERGRPDYSPEAVARLVSELGLGPGKRLLDLAAGTGKLTRQLVDTGAEIVAVEPIAEMRAKLEATVPGVEAIQGTAEDIPLPNHSIDAVVVGSAFHWFDGIRAATEVRRVLKPDGALGLIWQARDASDGWIRRLDEIIDGADDGHPRFRDRIWREAFDLTALFDPIEESTYDHIQRAAPDVIVDRVASISYVAAMTRERRERILEDVRELLRSDPATAGRDVVVLPYTAHIFWTRPRAIPAGPSRGLVVAVNTSPGGIPKRPVAWTRIRVGGPDGDGHGDTRNHGGPLQDVCLYSMEAIERIRADGHQAFPGAYGENLTLAGLEWAGLRTADRLEIGAAGAGPLLELTDFAVPCDKQARWFRDGRYGRISARSHPEDARWYARTIREGPVAPGDAVRLIRTA